MYIITMRDEDGTWYVDHVGILGTKAASSSLSSERRDAKPYMIQAYAIKVAQLLEAKWKAREAETGYAPRGPFKVRAL